MAGRGFSLKDAEELTPKSIRNEIYWDLDQMDRESSYVASNVFPLVPIGDPKELFYRLNVTRMPLPGSHLNAEAAVLGMDAPETDGYNIRTFKGKISPDKYLDGALNRDQDVLNIGNYVARNLRESLLSSREMAAFRGYNGVEGLIGPEGLSAHSDIPTEHVRPPSAGQYSARDSSDPHTDLMELRGLINEVGGGFGDVGDIQAWIPPSVTTDLMTNADLESRFSGVRVQNLGNMSVLSQVLPIPINEVKTQVARTNAMGEPLQPDGTLVTDPENQVVAKDNILEPYNTSRGGKVRNIIIGTPGADAACMPWMIERLADHIEDASDRADVDTTNGYYIRQYTDSHTTTHWREIGQEFGFELIRPRNFAVLQDV